MQYQSTDTLFSMEQETSVYSINLNLEEHRRYRLTSAQVRRVGFKRYGDGKRGA